MRRDKNPATVVAIAKNIVFDILVKWEASLLPSFSTIASKYSLTIWIE